MRGLKILGKKLGSIIVARLIMKGPRNVNCMISRFSFKINSNSNNSLEMEMGTG